MIIHADMDAFYAAVEQRDNPNLRGLPVIVGGQGPRGVVSTCSYEARKFGVHSAMPGSRARMLCPGAIFVSPRIAHYAGISRQIHEVFERYTPSIESIALDEAFLDVAGTEQLFGSPLTIARRICDEVRSKTGLTVSVGVATTKFVAKVASETAKPDGLRYVAPGEEEAFLRPLPVRCIWGAGPVAQAQLIQYGYKTIGDLQTATSVHLQRTFGENSGARYFRLSRGQDLNTVSEQTKKWISHEQTFEADIASLTECSQVLFALCQRVGLRLRRQAAVTGCVRLKLRYGDFKTVTRQCHVPATQDDVVIYERLRHVFGVEWSGAPVRLLGVAIGIAPHRFVQDELFDQGRPSMIAVLDTIRDRYGDGAIGFAGALPRSRFAQHAMPKQNQ